MMMNYTGKSNRHKLFSRTFLFTCLVFSCSMAIAQNNVQSEGDEFLDDDEFLEEVVVTGTRIKRRDFTSPSPLTTITKEEIEFSGQPTLEAYLNQMPQVQPGMDRSSNNPGNGTAQIDLRNLGPGRTLVLMNGRRMAPSGVGSAVDLNNLPSVLVDRVEIITGGASTVYGSDAIAGAVNFITRDDIEGLSFEGNYNISGEGDAEIWDFNVVYGHSFASGNGNITFYAGQYEREPLFASDREISRTPWLTSWEDTNYYPGGSSRTPAGVVFGPPYDFGNGPETVTFNPDGTPRPFVRPDDLWNYAPVNYLQVPLSRLTAGIMGNYRISDRFETYFEASYVKNEISQNLAPVPSGDFLFTNIDNPLWAPEMRPILESWQVEPGVAGLFFARRMLELGNRIFSYEKEYQRLVAGVRGEIFEGWDMDVWATYTKSDEIEDVLGMASASRLQQALFVDPATGQCFDPSGGCVPADIFGAGRMSAEAVDFISFHGLKNSTSRNQTLFAMVLTGSPFEIWSGPVDMAFGLEWREDEAHFAADPILFSGDVLGGGGDAPIDGTESVVEIYSEAIFTLFESNQSGQKLDMEIGARWSDYKNAGSVTTWKAGLDWQISESWRLRAMAQHAVRAPNNAELFTAQGAFQGFTITNNFNDPCSASSDPTANGNLEKCLAQGLSQGQIGVFEAIPFYPSEFIFGGNPNLTPESSDTFTAGFVFSPLSVSDLTLAVDYYQLEVTDTIGDIQPFDVCFDSSNTGGVFCDLIQRDASGNIIQEIGLFQNKGLLHTDGVDVQLRYQFDLPASLAMFDDARFSINSMWTHIFSNEQQENVATTIYDCNGLFGWPCGFSYPENRITTNFNYQSGDFTAHLTWRWIDGMDNAAPLRSGDFGYPDPILAPSELSSWSYLDLGFSYGFGDSISVMFGINNIADKEPAFMADAGRANNTDDRMYDVYGRSYYFNFRYQLGSN
ncbi:MAG: iron complex outermembrane receptor protein [Rhodothermales bacterium]|jgi:iron complex outermembrane receptor protein